MEWHNVYKVLIESVHMCTACTVTGHLQCGFFFLPYHTATFTSETTLEKPET